MVSFYSEPDAEIRSMSQDTLWVCQRARAQDYQLINVKNIQSVVAMVPFPLSDAESSTPAIKAKYGDSFYVAEKPFLPISQLSEPDLQNLSYIDDSGDDGDGNTTDEDSNRSDSGSSTASCSDREECDGESDEETTL